MDFDPSRLGQNSRSMKTQAALQSLAALAQGSRLAVFRYLVVRGPEGAFPGVIAEALDLSPATLSFHLKELSRANLIEAEQDGRFIRYRARFDTMQGLLGYLSENCCGGDPSKCAPGPGNSKATRAPGTTGARRPRRVPAVTS